MQASDAIDNGGRLSQKYGADLSQSGGSKILSGDADLPIKAPLADRRAKVDNVRTHPLAVVVCHLVISCQVTHTSVML